MGSTHRPDWRIVARCRELNEAGKSIVSVAREMNIPRPTVQSWKNDNWRFAAPPEEPDPIEPTPMLDLERLTQVLKTSPSSLDQLAGRFSTTRGAVLDAIDHLRDVRGLAIHVTGDRYGIDTAPAPAYATGDLPVYLSRPDGTYIFGAIGDTHYCSKHCREDVVEEFYDEFAQAEVDRVFHTGNWIDGEARFNKHEITVHGMDAQCRYLASKYPRREGIVTYAVTGDDHEGWYAQREGVDIGRYAEERFRDQGRQDWVNLGYMEAHIILRHAVTGAEATLAVVHPGGGSSYADSYTVQKIIESLDGGEKPAVALYGHYHKLLAGEYRNVWWLQTGCTQQQTTFGRKRKLRYVLGAAVVTLKQDAETGAIVEFTPRLMRRFVGQKVNNRWSHSGWVTQPDLANQ